MLYCPLLVFKGNLSLWDLVVFSRELMQMEVRGLTPVGLRDGQATRLPFSLDRETHSWSQILGHSHAGNVFLGHSSCSPFSPGLVC